MKTLKLEIASFCQRILKSGQEKKIIKIWAKMIKKLLAGKMAEHDKISDHYFLENID